MFLPWMLDCRRHAQRFKNAETIRNKANIRLLITIISNCYRYDRKSASSKMDLRQFRYFIQAARRENFRKASDDLRVAQSALTRQIQHLEQELGFLLFHRVKRGVRLTAAGHRLLERSQHILGEVDRLKETLQIEAHVPTGPASLAAPPSIGRLLFNRLALTFLKSYPKVNLSLQEGWTSNVLGQLRRGELSLAIVTDPPPDPMLEYTLLFTESLYLAGRPDDPRLKKRSLEVSSLGDLPLVMTSKNNRSRQLIENSAAREGAKLDIRLELESPETLRQLLLTGRIYGLLPYSSIFQDAQARRLGAVPIKGHTMTRYLAKSRQEASSVALETLEKSTIGEMRGLAKRIGVSGQ
jgi:LysR family transcriptional regulator, nitrogen assimilation regulatory protein